MTILVFVVKELQMNQVHFKEKIVIVVTSF